MSESAHQLAHVPTSELAAPAAASSAISPIGILEAAVRGGITAENVAVVKELAHLCREQRAEEAKAAFAKAFFQLRKNMPEIYADKEAKDRSGNVTFSYCSEVEISKKLEPHLMKYGFAMLFGQNRDDAQVVVNVTLMHEAGHSETREFAVRAGTPNAMKDAAMCDTGAATTAWRHLMMKMFGLKSRIADGHDLKKLGETISREQVMYLREQVRETGSDEKKFLAFAGVESFEEITTGVYDVLVRSLLAKRKSA